MVECALLLGEAALAMLEADRAASALRSAVVTADMTGHEGLVTLAIASAAQGHWWLGHFDEARRLFERAGVPAGSHPDTGAIAARTHAVASALALASGDVDQAVRHVTAAEAIAGQDPAARAIAAGARLRWLATIGDETALPGAARDALSLARAARDRPMALDIRLLRAEGALRARAWPAARLASRGFAHLAGRREPPLIAARARLVLLALARRDEAERLRDALVARGFGAFAHANAAALALPPPAPIPRSPMLDDVVEMFRVCQEEEPRAALVKVAELLRVRCSAAVVAIVTGGPAPATIAVPPSPRPVVIAVRRALDAGAAIDLHTRDAATEAAVPLLSAGVVVGAVGCRWVSQPPPDAAEVRRLLQVAAAAAAPCARALHELPSSQVLAPDVRTLVGGSQAMEIVRRSVAQAADAPFPVLIEAESGCGKELAARAIHRSSARKARPFCVVNGAALPDELLEAELFGHARGAFTGAVIERRGMFEEADGGVLFLDEVGELSPRAQAKLLRVLQDGEVRRIGETHVRRVDVRLVTATNRILEAEVQAGRFRRDLFYRLAVIRLRIPPLRDRVDDVPALAAALWMEVSGRVASRAVLAAGTLAALARYDWPGNVRELQNVLAALAVSAPRRGVIGPSALPAAIARAAHAPAVVTLDEARRHFEARFVRAALARAGGHRGRAAADLGLTRQGLAKLIDRLRIEEPDVPQADG
jgi:DNA-binding NtrC family response regulator